MKKFIAQILTITLLLGMMSVPAIAEDVATPEERIENFVDHIMELNNKREFVDLLKD